MKGIAASPIAVEIPLLVVKGIPVDNILVLSQHKRFIVNPTNLKHYKYASKAYHCTQCEQNHINLKYFKNN